jgi:hypothetical protein
MDQGVMSMVSINKEPPPVGEAARSAGGGRFTIEDRRFGHRPNTPPSVGCADTSPMGGGFS